MLDLEAYFRDCPYEYCILRMPESFPKYEAGSDLDILCRNVVKAVRYTLDFVKGRVAMRRTPSGHAHVDVRAGRKLDLRFDFIDTLQVYERFTVSDDFTDAVLTSRVRERGAFVPAPPFDLALRYMEYVERPRKAWHQRYISAHSDVDFVPILERYVHEIDNDHGV